MHFEQFATHYGCHHDVTGVVLFHYKFDELNSSSAANFHPHLRNAPSIELIQGKVVDSLSAALEQSINHSSAYLHCQSLLWLLN